MEIIRHRWEKKFWKIEIIHVYNWEDAWYPEKTLEDLLVRMENPWHYEGACNLMDAWIEQALRIDCDYIIMSAADTWLLDDEFIYGKIERMRNESKFLLTCPWGTPDMNDPRDVWFATDFFVLDARFEKKNHVFPLKYAEFKDKYIELIRYLWKGNVMAEKLFFSHFLTACNKDALDNDFKSYVVSKTLSFNERMPVHSTKEWDRTFSFPEIELYMNHKIEEKREMLNKKGITLGKYTEMLKNGEYIKN